MKNKLNIDEIAECLTYELKFRGVIDSPQSFRMIESIVRTSLYEHIDESLIVDCSCCEDKGYLEVTHDEGEYIEACQECDYFGMSGDQDDDARIAAKNDGYKLTRNGKIKG